MRSTHVVASLLLLGGMTATVVAQNQPAQPQNPPPANAGRLRKIGVVDIGVLFREYRRKDTLEQQVNVEREQVKKDLDARAEAIRKKRQLLDNSPFREGSEQWVRQRDEIKMDQFALELESERRQNGLKKRVEELTLTILSEIEWTIDKFGEQQGYDLILKSDKGAMDPTDQSELTAQFQERIFRAQISDVLFHSDSIDITEAVKRQLNSDASIRGAEERARAAQQPQAQAPGTPAATVPAGAPTTPPSTPGATPPSDGGKRP